jgi:hypothetical protein
MMNKDQKLCLIENCEKEVYCKGVCRNHYAQQLYRKKNAVVEVRCQFPNCNTRLRAKGRKFCSKHITKAEIREKRGLPLSYGDVRSYLLKGENNPRWSGGNSFYSNHYVLKKNRLERLKESPVCEVCNIEKSCKILHRNLNIQDHRKENLMALCHKCFGQLVVKYFRRNKNKS